jgi:hypothetical protein
MRSQRAFAILLTVEPDGHIEGATVGGNLKSEVGVDP